MKKLETLIQRLFSFFFIEPIPEEWHSKTYFQASVCFPRESVNTTFIVQNDTKILTRTQNENTKDAPMVTRPSVLFSC